MYSVKIAISTDSDCYTTINGEQKITDYEVFVTGVVPSTSELVTLLTNLKTYLTDVKYEQSTSEYAYKDMNGMKTRAIKCLNQALNSRDHDDLLIGFQVGGNQFISITVSKVKMVKMIDVNNSF
jgi:hypothetical protein